VCTDGRLQPARAARYTGKRQRQEQGRQV